jgi:hypothetical protein
VLAGAARADTIEEFFIQDGTALNVSGGSLGSCAAGATCRFSGTMMVDVTSSEDFPDGTVTALDISFPGVVPFGDIMSEPSIGSTWSVISGNGNGPLSLDFTTTKSPASLVGFDGGSITGNSVEGREPGGPDVTLYVNISGDITPVPEPFSLALLGAGVLTLVQGLRRKLS